MVVRGKVTVHGNKQMMEEQTGTVGERPRRNIGATKASRRFAAQNDWFFRRATRTKTASGSRQESAAIAHAYDRVSVPHLPGPAQQALRYAERDFGVSRIDYVLGSIGHSPKNA